MAFIRTLYRDSNEITVSIDIPVPDIDTDLLGYWPLDEIIEDFTPDQSGLGNDGAIVDNPLLVSGQIADAFDINATGVLNFFRKGDFDGSTAFAESIVTISNDIGIGSRPGVNNTAIQSVDGLIDEVRIYNRPLNRAEIQRLSSI